MKDVVVNKSKISYSFITIDLTDDFSFNVNIYDKPLSCSNCCDEWHYYDNGIDKLWIYDFSYRPSLLEILDVLLSKLNSLGLR